MNTLADLVEEATTTVDSLSANQFAAEADQPHTVVVDVREADERVQTGSIANAIHIPRGLLEFRADPTNPGHDPRLRPNARVLLCCDDGARATLAAASLQHLGYTAVALLRGGLRAWDAARLPLIGRMSSPY